MHFSYQQIKSLVEYGPTKLSIVCEINVFLTCFFIDTFLESINYRSIMVEEQLLFQGKKTIYRPLFLWVRLANR